MKKRLLLLRVFFLILFAAALGILIVSVATGEAHTAAAAGSAVVPFLCFLATFIPEVGKKDRRRYEKLAECFMDRAFDGCKKERKLFIRAVTFWQQNKNAEAVSVLEHLYNGTENAAIRARARFLAGRCHQEQKEYAQAKQLYEEALSLDPTMAMAWSNLATVRDVLGAEPEEMIRCLETAVFYDPNYEVAYGKLGMYYNMLHDFERSERALCTAIRLNPRRAVNYANYSWALISAGKLDEAEEAYRQAIVRGYKDESLGQMLADAKAAAKEPEREERRIGFL